MITVHFEFELAYDHDRGRPAPMLVCGLSAPRSPDLRVYTKLLLDSGAEVTLLEGSLAGELGIDLDSAPNREVEGLGGRLLGKRHALQIHNDVLGTYLVDACFGPKDVQVAPAILGRDFFRLARIGFDERNGLLQFARHLHPAEQSRMPVR